MEDINHARENTEKKHKIVESYDRELRGLKGGKETLETEIEKNLNQLIKKDEDNQLSLRDKKSEEVRTLIYNICLKISKENEERKKEIKELNNLISKYEEQGENIPKKERRQRCREWT